MSLSFVIGFCRHQCLLASPHMSPFASFALNPWPQQAVAQSIQDFLRSAQAIREADRASAAGPAEGTHPAPGPRAKPGVFAGGSKAADEGEGLTPLQMHQARGPFLPTVSKFHHLLTYC